MDERVRRLWAGAEAEAIGRGGIAAVARATGLAISTVTLGRNELRAGARADKLVKVRRKGGGRRRHEAVHPELVPALEKLVYPVTRGDPESPLRWTCKSTRALSAEMFTRYGLRVGNKTVARLLRDRGYSLQAARNTPRRWNKVEHRLFSFITVNWRGRPLRTYETVVNLIGNTTTRAGLVVRASLDRRSYPIGKKVSAKDLRELNV